jgi:hypothetical protein
MSAMTYNKNSEKPVPAKPGKCDGCGAIREIVMKSSNGNFCTPCSDNMEATWERMQKPDWNSRAKQGVHPPLNLEDDGTKP